MMMPASKGTSFEMVETQFPFEVFVHTLGPVPLLHQADQGFHRRLLRKRREPELRRRKLAFGLFHQQPDLLVVGAARPMLYHSHATTREPGRHHSLGPLAPGDLPKSQGCISVMNDQDLADVIEYLRQIQ